MKKQLMIVAGMLTTGLAGAENLQGVDRMVCAAADVQICIEHDMCYSAAPMDLGVPEFVVIDLDDKTISTTQSSSQNRSSTFTSVMKKGGLIFLQGIEVERAFSFIIDEVSGRMTVAVSLDGMSVSVFGACTDTDL